MKINHFSIPGNPRGLRGFFAWLDVAQPAIARAVARRMAKPAALAGLGITAPSTVTDSQSPAAPSTIDKVKDILLGVSSAYLTYEQLQAQKKVMSAQLARAQAGLPPLAIDMEQYGLTGPSVSVGLSSSTKTLLIAGAAGLGLVYLLPKFLKR